MLLINFWFNGLSFAAEKRISCTPVPAEVSGFIAGFTSAVRGAEYCEFRKIATGDINGDGEEDLIVAFNVEGACGAEDAEEENSETTPGACGNHVESYLVARLAGKKSGFTPVYLFKDGAFAGVENISVKNRSILVEAMAYSDNDARCCPTNKIIYTFKLENEALKVTAKKMLKKSAGSARRTERSDRDISSSRP
jgi:hypothetical protein